MGSAGTLAEVIASANGVGAGFGVDARRFDDVGVGDNHFVIRRVVDGVRLDYRDYAHVRDTREVAPRAPRGRGSRGDVQRKRMDAMESFDHRFAASELALQRAAKASCAALTFSALPPHALRQLAWSARP